MEEKIRRIMQDAKNKYGIPVDSIISAFDSISEEIKKSINFEETKRNQAIHGEKSGDENLSETERLSRLTELRRKEREKATAENLAKGRRVKNTKRVKRNGKRRRSAAEIATLIASVVLLVSGVTNLIDVTSDSEWVLGVAEGIKLALPFVCSSFGFAFSAFFKRRSERYALYSVMIGDSGNFRLAELAEAAYTSVKKVRRDLQNMIGDGDFGGEAYIDVKRQMFFRTLRDAEEFGNTERICSLGDEKQAEDKVERDEYRELILEIRRLNDEIADIAVSERIYRIEEISQNIFDYVKEKPTKRQSIRTFMNYYLPTTMKLLNSYAKIEKAGVAGENMKKSKESIEGTLDMLVYAFKQQLDSLYMAESIDISSDIDVLETMLTRDGMARGWSDELRSSGTATEENK